MTGSTQVAGDFEAERNMTPSAPSSERARLAEPGDDAEDQGGLREIPPGTLHNTLIKPAEKQLDVPH